MRKTIKPDTNRNGHLDPDTLGAFAENALPDAEAATVFAHLADCQRCRDWFGVNAESGSARRRSAWYGSSTFYLKTAAGLACAALAGGLMILPAHHQQTGPASATQSVADTPMEAKPQTPAPLEREVNSGITRATAQRTLELPAASGRHGAAQQRSFLHRPITSRIFTSDFASVSTNDQSTLPAPLASARLESQVSFVTISPDSRKQSANQAGRIPLYNQIPVKTMLGVRWICLSLR